MLAKMIIEDNLIAKAINFENEDIYCEIEMEAGDDFQSLIYKNRYKYDTTAYLGPVSTDQSDALQMLQGKNINSIIDIGSGSGYITQWLGLLDFDVTACEVDPYAVMLCRHRGLRKIVEGSFYDVTDSFDAAILMGGSISTYEICDLDDAIKSYILNAKKIIKHNGFLLTDLSYYHIPMLSQNKNYKVSKVRFGVAENWTEHSFHIYPHPNIFAGFMQRNGFTLEQQIVVDIGSSDAAVQQRYYSLWRLVAK